MIVYTIARHVETFFEILGVRVFGRESFSKYERGNLTWRCPLYVAATSNLKVHISKLDGWKIYIYIYIANIPFRKRFNVFFPLFIQKLLF